MKYETEFVLSYRDWDMENEEGSSHEISYKCTNPQQLGELLTDFQRFLSAVGYEFEPGQRLAIIDKDE